MAELHPVAAMLSRGPLQLAQSAKIVTKLCELLAPLHDARRVHGAVTPENVHVRHVGSDLTVELRDEAAPTPVYSTPEIIGGRPLSPSSDVYRLGVLFFHMIAGAPPFEGETEDEIFEKHLSNGPPALGNNELQEVPLELESLVRAMLAKDPTRRPAVRKIAADLENIDLDSTIMGQTIRAAVYQVESDLMDAGDSEATLLQNVHVDRDGLTDPNVVDPYADTMIRTRDEIGLVLEDVDRPQRVEVQWTRGPTSGWNDDPTRILLHTGEAASEEDEIPAEVPGWRPSPRSPLIFLLGLIVVVMAVATSTFVMLR